MVSLKADIINSVMATTFQTFCLWEVANQKKGGWGTGDW